MALDVPELVRDARCASRRASPTRSRCLSSVTRSVGPSPVDVGVLLRVVAGIVGRRRPTGAPPSAARARQSSRPQLGVAHRVGRREQRRAPAVTAHGDQRHRGPGGQPAPADGPTRDQQHVADARPPAPRPPPTAARSAPASRPSLCRSSPASAARRCTAYANGSCSQQRRRQAVTSAGRRTAAATPGQPPRPNRAIAPTARAERQPLGDQHGYSRVAVVLRAVDLGRGEHLGRRHRRAAWAAGLAATAAPLRPPPARRAGRRGAWRK